MDEHEVDDAPRIKFHVLPLGKTGLKGKPRAIAERGAFRAGEEIELLNRIELFRFEFDSELAHDRGGAHGELDDGGAVENTRQSLRVV